MAMRRESELPPPYTPARPEQFVWRAVDYHRNSFQAMDVGVNVFFSFLTSSTLVAHFTQNVFFFVLFSTHCLCMHALRVVSSDDDFIISG